MSRGQRNAGAFKLLVVSIAVVGLAPVAAGDAGPDRILGRAVTIHSDGFVAGSETSGGGKPAVAPCIGNGTSGRRVALYYGRGPGDAALTSTVASAIRQMAAGVNAAWRTVAGKDVRWRCMGGVVSINTITISAHRLSSCRSALKSAGYERADRIYICLMRTSADGYGGQAEILHGADAKVSPSPHDTGPRYAAVYSLLSSADGTMMHEFGHTIGAVQCSAPHSSCPDGDLGNHHCYEEQDVMCYRDGGSFFDSGGAIVNRCPTAPTIADRWDCGRDDYFSANPSPSTYLATHWNTNDSLFLERAT